MFPHKLTTQHVDLTRRTASAEHRPLQLADSACNQCCRASLYGRSQFVAGRVSGPKRRMPPRCLATVARAGLRDRRGRPLLDLSLAGGGSLELRDVRPEADDVREPPLIHRRPPLVTARLLAVRLRGETRPVGETRPMWRTQGRDAAGQNLPANWPRLAEAGRGWRPP